MNDSSKPVTIIFGGGGGIGSDLARCLFQRGHQLVLCGRNLDSLNTVAEPLGRVETISVDVSRPDQVDGVFAKVVQKFGRVDGVAHSVGSILLKPIHQTSDDEWHDTLATNLHSAFYVTRAACRAMITKGGGNIVLVSSAAARIGLANHEAIAASKAGIIGLVLSTAATYANKNIRINCVAPGLVRTPLTQRLTSNEASLKVSQSMHALGRIGEVADVAKAMEWLLDPENQWITGQVIGIDGGLGTIRSRG